MQDLFCHDTATGCERTAWHFSPNLGLLQELLAKSNEKKEERHFTPPSPFFTNITNIIHAVVHAEWANLSGLAFHTLPSSYISSDFVV